MAQQTQTNVPIFSWLWKAIKQKSLTWAGERGQATITIAGDGGQGGQVLHVHRIDIWNVGQLVDIVNAFE